MNKQSRVLVGSLIITISACTLPVLPSTSQIEIILSEEVWPGFSPLEGNIAVFNHQEIRKVSSICSPGCSQLPNPGDIPSDMRFVIADNHQMDWSAYRYDDLVATTRLIAHEQFHVYQKSAEEFPQGSVTNYYAAPDSLRENSISAVIAMSRHLADRLESKVAENSCASVSLELPAGMTDWLIQLERIEGLAQYVDLQYGRIAINADDQAVERLLGNALRSTNPDDYDDVFDYLRGLMYLTGAARAQLDGVSSVLEGTAHGLACTPTTEETESALRLIERTKVTRARAENALLNADRLAMYVLPNTTMNTSARKRLNYPWGHILLEGATLYAQDKSSSFQLDSLEFIAIINCPQEKSVLLYPHKEGGFNELITRKMLTDTSLRTIVCENE